jgi:hypothetical protein
LRDLPPKQTKTGAYPSNLLIASTFAADAPFGSNSEASHISTIALASSGPTGPKSLTGTYGVPAPYQISPPSPGKSIAEAAAIYFDEIMRTAPIESKTELDRGAALELLADLSGHKTITAISKSDTQEAKRVRGSSLM